MCTTMNKRNHYIGDIVFFLDELSLKTGVIVGFTKECEDDEIALICDARCKETSYIVSEINSDKKVKAYTKNTLVEAELMTIEEAIGGLNKRIKQFIIS